MTQTLLDLAAKIVIMDAIERGHTNPAELTEYAKSNVFENAVINTAKTIKELMLSQHN